MNIKLIRTQVDSLSIAKSSENRGKMHLDLSTIFNDDDTKEFAISFGLSLNSEEGYEINTTFIATFTSDEDIIAEKREMSFFSVNAPAIGYPFLRAYIANLMLSSGFEPIMLPTINFVEFIKKKSQKDSG